MRSISGGMTWSGQCGLMTKIGGRSGPSEVGGGFATYSARLASSERSAADLKASPLPSTPSVVEVFLVVGLLACQYYDPLGGLLGCWVFGIRFDFASFLCCNWRC